MPGSQPLVRENETPVLIAGGGMVGLSAATFLAHQGIPSIAIGVGGDSGGIHTLEEWYANDGGALGVERALLVVLAAAGVTGERVNG